MWQQRNFVATEFRDVRIHSAVLIDAKDTEVKLRVSLREGVGQVYHGDRLVASMEVRDPEKTPLAPLEEKAPLQENEVPGGQFYSYIRKYGYEYQGVYQRVTNFDYKSEGGTMLPAADWISYLDGCLHPVVLRNEVPLLPTSFGKVVLQAHKLEQADPRIFLDGFCRRLGNSTVRIEDWRFEMAGDLVGASTIVKSCAGMLQYGVNAEEDAKFLGQVLQFESASFSKASETPFTAEVASWLGSALEEVPGSPVIVCDGEPPEQLVEDLVRAALN